MLYFHLFVIEAVADVGNLINEFCHNFFFMNIVPLQVKIP